MTVSRCETEARIIALQALSTFYLPEASSAPGASYGWVSYRMLGRYLNRDPSRLYQTLAVLAASGFCEVTPSVARLSPERWAANSSRYSSYLSYYVANAPFSLRGEDSLWPIDPRSCYNPQSTRHEGKSACSTSPFTGVYDAAKYRALCEVPSGISPLESVPLWHEVSCPEQSIAENLEFLISPCTKFRSFLAAIYLQTVSVPSLTGVVGELLADYMSTVPSVVFVPGDALNLPLLSATPCQLPASAFVAPLPACSSLPIFGCVSAYPMSFATLGGGAIVLTACGQAQVQTSSCIIGTFGYSLVGPALEGFIVALTSLLPPGSALAPNPPFAGEPTARTLVQCG